MQGTPCGADLHLPEDFLVQASHEVIHQAVQVPAVPVVVLLARLVLSDEVGHSFACLVLDLAFNDKCREVGAEVAVASKLAV